MKYTICLLPGLVSSFSVLPSSTTRVLPHGAFLLAAEESSDQEEGLVLDGLDKEMNSFKSEISFGEFDFLAAARKRAEERKESVNSSASDEEWLKMADEKAEAFGDIDDWENSKKEAGNADSQILMFTDPPADGDDESSDGGGDKLLLF
jgi:hypothetical protein